MKVISYLKGIPIKNNKAEKKEILTYFIDGVNFRGDQGIVNDTFNIIDCDLAVLQGWVHEQSKNLPHLQLRRNVLLNQKNKNKKTLIADSNLFLYLNKSNSPFHYIRYSFDNVFRNKGFYFDKDIDPDRWKKIQNDLQINVKDYRTNGSHILFCLQRNGGWSMHGVNVIDLVTTIIAQIKRCTDRPIIIRGHPGDKKTTTVIQNKLKNVRFSNTEKLQDDLKNAWATLTYNSSPGVASLIEGIPVFQLDPNKGTSMYSEIANFDLQKIESPEISDRQKWLERISMCHWKFDELRSGEAWNFMKAYL